MRSLASWFQGGCFQLVPHIQDKSDLAQSILSLPNHRVRETEIISFICLTKSCCAKAALLKLQFYLCFCFSDSISRINVCMWKMMQTFCGTQKGCGTYRTWDCQTFVRGEFGQRCLYFKALILLFRT